MSTFFEKNLSVMDYMTLSGLSHRYLEQNIANPESNFISLINSEEYHNLLRENIQGGRRALSHHQTLPSLPTQSSSQSSLHHHQPIIDKTPSSLSSTTKHHHHHTTNKNTYHHRSHNDKTPSSSHFHHHHTSILIVINTSTIITPRR